MNSLILAIMAGLLYIIAYYTYGRFLARNIFKVDPLAVCPSETHHDGIYDWHDGLGYENKLGHFLY